MSGSTHSAQRAWVGGRTGDDGSGGEGADGSGGEGDDGSGGEDWDSGYGGRERRGCGSAFGCRDGVRKGSAVGLEMGSSGNVDDDGCDDGCCFGGGGGEGGEPYGTGEGGGAAGFLGGFGTVAGSGGFSQPPPRLRDAFLGGSYLSFMRSTAWRAISMGNWSSSRATKPGGSRCTHGAYTQSPRRRIRLICS